MSSFSQNQLPTAWIFYQHRGAEHLGRPPQMQPVSTPNPTARWASKCWTSQQALCLLRKSLCWAKLHRTPKECFLPQRFLHGGSLQYQYSSRWAENTSLTPCSVHQQSKWPRWQKKQGCSHLLCHWSKSQTMTNAETIMDKRIRDKELALHHCSLYLWGLGRFLFLRKDHLRSVQQ